MTKDAQKQEHQYPPRQDGTNEPDDTAMVVRLVVQQTGVSSPQQQQQRIQSEEAGHTDSLYSYNYNIDQLVMVVPDVEEDTGDEESPRNTSSRLMNARHQNIADVQGPGRIPPLVRPHHHRHQQQHQNTRDVTVLKGGHGGGRGTTRSINDEDAATHFRTTIQIIDRVLALLDEDAFDDLLLVGDDDHHLLP